MRLLTLLALVLAATGCDSNDPAVRIGDAIDPADPTKCLEGVTTVETLDATNGQRATPASTVVVSYVGTLEVDGETERFDGSPRAVFPLSRTVTGFGEGIGGRAAADGVPAIAGMRTGERRLITIPPNLAYGFNGQYQGSEHVIPRCATLTFDVTLLDLG